MYSNGNNDKKDIVLKLIFSGRAPIVQKVQLKGQMLQGIFKDDIGPLSDFAVMMADHDRPLMSILLINEKEIACI